MDYLAHYGVSVNNGAPGVGTGNWRRNPESHTISKAMPVYRATTKPGEVKDRLYVTFTKEDRALYKGTYGQGELKKNQGGGELYETRYSLSEDLKIPSRATVANIIREELTKDKRFSKEAATAQAGFWYMKDYFENTAYYSDKMQKKSAEYTSGKINIDEFSAAFDREVAKVGKQWIDQRSKQYESLPYDRLVLEGAQSFGVSDYNKEKVIKRLESMGYNAMVDEAGVGENSAEGTEPLIIFKSSSVVPEDSEKISVQESIRQDKIYDDWQRKSSSKRRR